jgi:hypothetical protein
MSLKEQSETIYNYHCAFCGSNGMGFRLRSNRLSRVKRCAQSSKAKTPDCLQVGGGQVGRRPTGQEKRQANDKRNWVEEMVQNESSKWSQISPE